MNMKNGFTTLNRLLGKKSKSNTNLSKSTNNISVTTPTTNIDDSSQMQQNRITPLPVATSNAPFEQTFRITVLLPKDQLYVARLGARVLLHKLLELVCENKQLDADKYEFRHPSDPSQVFSCDLTIGAVGLSEIRMCHKSEAYDTFNADEIITLHRTTAGRDSMSSSEFSSRNSKHTIKTPSPYSSSNSLNSMDSAGMHSNYRHSTPKVFAQQSGPPVAPTRKKRLAPRPPSQNSIPEKPVPSVPTSTNKKTSSPKALMSSKVNGVESVSRKDFHASSPNLSQTLELSVFSTNDFHKSNVSVDCNGNTSSSPNNNKSSTQQNGYHLEANGGVHLKRPMSLHILSRKEPDTSINCNGGEAVKNARNSFNDFHNLTAIEAPHIPEPSPRKKVLKAKKSAPAPPPRSLQSPAQTIEESPPTPEDEEPPPVATVQPPRPIALPRSSAGRLTPEPTESVVSSPQNISKTMLNRSPTPEPRAVPQNAELPTMTTPEDGFDTQSKQADSGIGEPFSPSPILSSVQNSPKQCKSPFESSSDDDEMIKVYNLKLGKTIVKTLSDHKTFEDLTVLSTDESEAIDRTRTPVENCSIKSETTSWSNFTIPAPPTFADNTKNEKLPDTPITPIIKERLDLDFTSLSLEQTDNAPVMTREPSAIKEIKDKSLECLDTANGVLETEDYTKDHHKTQPEIIETETIITDEFEPQDHNRPTVIVSKRSIVTKNIPSLTDPDGIGEQEQQVINEMDTIINSIETIIHQKPLFSTLDRLGVPEEDEEEDLKESRTFKKRSSITLHTNILKHRRSITRSDSFHSTREQQVEEIALRTENGMAARSSSFLSLAKFGSENQNTTSTEETFSRRRSSSELSIGESPSLQSVEVMKSILNSRKNSLTSQSSTEDPKSPPSTCDISHSTQQPSPKSNILRTQVTKAAEEKVYRYSGPPSINFSTWSERPKVQVSIKNEGDYIFGGKTGGHNATTTATVNLVQQRNHRNSTPDAVVNRLPFVRSVEYKKVTSAMAPLKETNSIHSIVKDPTTPTPQSPSSPTTTVNFKQTTMITSPLRETKSRYSVANEPATPPPTPQTPSPPTTMPKPKFMLGGRMSNPSPVVRGFSLTTAAPQSINSSTLPRSHANPASSLLRSTSVTQFDVKPKPVVDHQTQPVFGQGTLRKTGLKEKILASQDNESPKHVPTVLKTPESAKIEMKITKTCFPYKKEQSSIGKSTPAAPPPPPPIIRAVVTKQNSNGSPTSLSVDPRDQLLTAIRSFKRDELKRI